MKHLALAVLLACMLSGTAHAGEIPSTGVAAPQPRSTVTTTGEIPTSDRTGEIPSGGRSTQASSTLITIIVTLLTIGR